MRLNAQAKGGFYPAPLAAVRSFARHLIIQDPGRTVVLDPCCGEGEALAELLEAAGVPDRNAYAIEIEDGRSVRTLERLPNAHVLGNADFLGTTISPQSFSLAWVNPPFDNEYDGDGRVEQSFLSRATLCLCKGGVLAFVLPEPVLRREWEIRNHFGQWYSHLATFAFPNGHRRFEEVIVVGTRKDRPVRAYVGVYQGSGLLDLAFPLPSSGPNRWIIEWSKRLAVFCQPARRK